MPNMASHGSICSPGRLSNPESHCGTACWQSGCPVVETDINHSIPRW